MILCCFSYTTSSHAFACSVVHDAKENQLREKNGRANIRWLRSQDFTGPFFPRGLFTVSLDGRSEKRVHVVYVALEKNIDSRALVGSLQAPSSFKHYRY